MIAIFFGGGSEMFGITRALKPQTDTVVVGALSVLSRKNTERIITG